MLYKSRTNEDWKFTNTIHRKLVSPLFKTNFGITLIQATRKQDLKDNIDYIGLKNQKKYSFQERIRRNNQYTKNSHEFTLRYQRENSSSENQKMSEFFKIKSQFLFYAILNENEDDFSRYCVINIKALLKNIKNGLIDIDLNEDNNKHKAYLKNDKPVCIVKHNYEDKKGNSSFIIFNVNHIKYKIDINLPENERIIINEVGYNYSLKNNKINKMKK